MIAKHRHPLLSRELSSLFTGMAIEDEVTFVTPDSGTLGCSSAPSVTVASCCPRASWDNAGPLTLISHRHLRVLAPGLAYLPVHFTAASFRSLLFPGSRRRKR